LDLELSELRNHEIPDNGSDRRCRSRIVKQLLERDIRPRVLVRDQAKATSLFGDRVEVVTGDLAEPEDLRRAFEGVETVYLVNVGPQIPQRDEMSAMVAKQKKVKRIVKLSSLDVEHALAIGAWHEKGEAAIRATGIPYTFVRPSGFMSNFLAWSNSIRLEGVVRSSTADGHRPFIHSEDIAAVSVEALLSEDYRGECLPLTGRSLSPSVRQRTLSRLRLEKLSSSSPYRTKKRETVIPRSAVLQKRQKRTWPYGERFEKIVWRGSLTRLNAFSDEEPSLCGSGPLKMLHAFKKWASVRADESSYVGAWENASTAAFRPLGRPSHRHQNFSSM
jgi:uncharacterized protein YbjT (DUF2867 family)